ncbi:hypothetical protein EV379_1934 [Microterricola gilva]|uniref:CAAX prenyl protease 2/Lysostaphin resistance protein A-like domain-containing protein n=2 Tax=Microterricola gilva TaxID=393267 RepID=A0A4Q8ALZ0_9MICO|nr:hypothetical protein EV379_1934 [Microterricola gilva]
MRVTPRVWIGFAIWIGYTALVVGIQSLSGISYTAWGDSAANLFFGAGVSLIIATVALALTTSALGWWRPAMRERQRSRHRWPIIAPVFFALLALVNLLLTDWGSYDLPFLGASLVLLLVGFTEELTARGLLLTALRSRLHEGWVWFLTSLCFGLFHLVNILLGQDAFVTVEQVIFAFLVGTAFYILRRVTGSLVYAMILHAVWDFSVFAVAYGHPSELANIVTAVVPLAGVIALIAVPFVIRGADERLPRPVPSAGASATS